VITHNDLKRQLQKAKEENEMLIEAKNIAQQDLQDSNTLLESASLGTEE
jgi:hypothetical protein